MQSQKLIKWMQYISIANARTWTAAWGPLWWRWHVASTMASHQCMGNLFKCVSEPHSSNVSFMLAGYISGPTELYWSTNFKYLSIDSFHKSLVFQGRHLFSISPYTISSKSVYGILAILSTVTSSLAIDTAGFNGKFHLLVGLERARQPWDPDSLLAKGRMPSLFFCSPIPSGPERAALLQHASPQSRIMLSHSIWSLKTRSGE